MGWRLAYEAWGEGLATEGAAAALAWGFANLDTPEIVAFTARSNLRSQAVMRRIGMTPAPERDFLHPNLAHDHPLRPHRSEEHTSELQSLMRISYAVFCL